MFGFPSYYDAPRRYQEPSRSSYDPFGLGFGRPTHRPQSHTAYRNPYQHDPRYYQEDSDEEEQQYYPRQQPQRAAPQQQVRLDQLTPQQRLYLQQQQQQRLRQEQLQKLQRQREQQEEEDDSSDEEEQYQQHQQKYRRPQQSTQHHRQQRPQPQQPQRPQPKAVLKEVDLDKEARKIQRQWRGFDVRRHDLINKLRALSRIEGEVDALVATPINQQILGLSTSEPLPPSLDTYYVGNIPRNVLMLEHELTSKLLALDEISGHSEIIRPRRKGLVNKIEGILSRVDAIKKGYATIPAPPNPTPVISTPDDHATSKPATSTETTDTTNTTTTENKKKESEYPSTSVADSPMKDSEDSEDTDSSGVAASMDSMDIQDVSAPTPTIPAPSVTPAPVPSSSSIPSSSSSSTHSSNQIPSLKHMCFKLCDSLIKQSLIVH